MQAGSLVLDMFPPPRGIFSFLPETSTVSVGFLMSFVYFILLIFKIESCCIIHSDLELTLTQAGSDSPQC